MNRRVVGVGEEVVDEVGFSDDVCATIIKGVNFSFVNKLINLISSKGRPLADLTCTHYIGCTIKHTLENFSFFFLCHCFVYLSYLLS